MRILRAEARSFRKFNHEFLNELDIVVDKPLF